MTILEWIQRERLDVVFVTKEVDGSYSWDTTLPNQFEIQDLVLSYDPSLQFTEEQKKQKQRQFDFHRFKQRAAAKNELLAEMAAGNMERVRQGIWTVQELIGLTQDSELKQLLDDVNTLSFEIAYSRIDSLTNAILTKEIKNSWKKLLQEHFYL